MNSPEEKHLTERSEVTVTRLNPSINDLDRSSGKRLLILSVLEYEIDKFGFVGGKNLDFLCSVCSVMVHRLRNR